MPILLTIISSRRRCSTISCNNDLYVLIKMFRVHVYAQRRATFSIDQRPLSSEGNYDFIANIHFNTTTYSSQRTYTRPIGTDSSWKLLIQGIPTSKDSIRSWPFILIFDAMTGSTRVRRFMYL